MWYWVLSLVKTLERCFSFSVNDTGGLGEKSENSQQQSNLSIPFHPIPTHSTPHHSILFCSTLTSWISRASPWSISDTLKNHTNQIFFVVYTTTWSLFIVSNNFPQRTLFEGDVWSKYSLTSPYGHLSITDSSFGPRNAKNYIPQLPL